MSENTMFEQASRIKLRFNYKGVISVEDLWDLPLTALDLIFMNLMSEVKKHEQESLLKKKTSADKVLDLQVSIVKYVFETKQKERDEKTAAVEKAAKKQKILSLIAEKQDENLKSMSVEDLNKMMEEL